MGNCMITVDSHNGKDVEIFNKIHLSKLDVAEFFSLFNEIDVDGSGQISLHEFLVTFRLEDTPLIRLILGSFGVKHLDFLTFTCLIWNFLSIDESLLPQLMFFIFDTEKSDNLSFSEVEKKVRSLHSNWRNTPKLVAALHAMEAQCGDSGVTMAKYAEFCRAFPVLSAPMTTVQFHFRDKIKGINFWHNIAVKRNRHDQKYLLNPRYVYDLVEERRKEIENKNIETEKGTPNKTKSSKNNAASSNSQKKSERKKQNAVHNAARRLSTRLLPKNSDQIEFIVSKQPKHSKKQGFVDENQSNYTKNHQVTNEDMKYGYKTGDPDLEDDMTSSQIESKNDSNYREQSRKEKENLSSSKSKKRGGKVVNTVRRMSAALIQPKAKEKRVHPNSNESESKKSKKTKKKEDDFTSMEFEDNEASKKPKLKASTKETKSKKSGGVRSAIRRLSTTIADTTTRSRKKDRSRQYVKSVSCDT